MKRVLWLQFRVAVDGAGQHLHMGKEGGEKFVSMIREGWLRGYEGDQGGGSKVRG
ncbi:MAG: hypothetical protein PHY05_02380 [Methanothrix sp.]|nr:hypothetical protein [Methanothrix sp.]